MVLQQYPLLLHYSPTNVNVQHCWTSGCTSIFPQRDSPPEAFGDSKFNIPSVFIKSSQLQWYTKLYMATYRLVDQININTVVMRCDILVTVKVIEEILSAGACRCLWCPRRYTKPRSSVLGAVWVMQEKDGIQFSYFITRSPTRVLRSIYNACLGPNHSATLDVHHNLQLWSNVAIHANPRE